MISKTYVINLARRMDKRKRIESEFNKLREQGTNLNHVFFEAIDGNDSEVLSQYHFHIPGWYDPNSGKTMTNGEVGCALSHYSIWCDIVKSVENGTLPSDCNVLILEDDVIFLDNFEHKLESYCREIDLDYDMLYLHRKPLNLEAETKLSLHINRIKKSYWACAYILTYSGAKKLVNANYLENLIPTDEFLPIMYGCVVMGFEKLFAHCEKLVCFAIYPSLLKLTGDAFNDSETFHSEPFATNSQKYEFGNGNEFVVLYLGPTSGNGYERFDSYCKVYGIPYQKIGDDSGKSHYHALQQELKTWTKTRLDHTLLLLVSIRSNEECNVIPISSPAEIIDKFNILANNANSIVVSRNNTASQKLLLCAWASRLLKLTNDYSNKIIEIEKKKGTPLITIMTLESFSSHDIINDDKNEIFQYVNEDSEFEFDHKASRIRNEETNTTPCIVFADEDDPSTILLGRIENYTGNGWNEFYGFTVPKKQYDELPKIYFSTHVQYNINVLRLIATINYPRDNLTIRINRIGPVQNDNEIGYRDEDALYNGDVLNFLSTDCDYYFFVDKSSVITNKDVLRDLLSLGKDVVAPLIRRHNNADDSWTNFWGDLDENGYYERSPDYFDIIENERRGCWNVPYITGVYLIKRSVLEAVPNLFRDERDLDIDMRMCCNLRKNGVLLYVSNLQYYGYIEEAKEAKEIQEMTKSIPFQVPNSNGQLTIYDLFTRRHEWEERYLHPQFLFHKNNYRTMPHVELCGDVFNFPLFSEAFCSEMIKFMEMYGKWSCGNDEHDDPRLGDGYYENVPTSDIQLFEIGYDKHWHEIVFCYLAPFIKVLYSNYLTKDINLAFVVKYSKVGQDRLEPHHDDSAWTANIALNAEGKDFEGSCCRFIRQNYILKNRNVGDCTVHPGKLTHYHEALPITSGTRYILVSFIR